MNQNKPTDPETAAAAVDDANGPQEAAAPIEPADAAVDSTEADSTGAEPAEAATELEAELSETKDRLLRALAETENLRQRATRDVEDARRYAITGFARELLEVADNLSRALGSIPVRAREEVEFVKTLADGVAMTQKALAACFERHRIVEVAPELGTKFDHNRHQAMFEIETDEHAPGTIAQVLQCGYVIADRLLRPALVGVAKAASAKPDAGASSNTEAGSGRSVEVEPGERLDTTA